MPTLEQMRQTRDYLNGIMRVACMRCGSLMRYKKSSKIEINCYACDTKENKELSKLPDYLESARKAQKVYKRLPGKRQRVQKTIIEKYAPQAI